MTARWAKCNAWPTYSSDLGCRVKVEGHIVSYLVMCGLYGKNIANLQALLLLFVQGSEGNPSLPY